MLRGNSLQLCSVGIHINSASIPDRSCLSVRTPLQQQALDLLTVSRLT